LNRAGAGRTICRKPIAKIQTLCTLARFRIRGSTMGHENPLTNLRIAKPCTADWGAMKGDERVRQCELCQLNVYNITAMTRDEAVELIQKTEGRLCIRFYQRKDGTVLTANCPVGVRAAAKKWVIVASVLLSSAAALVIGTMTLRPRRLTTAELKALPEEEWRRELEKLAREDDGPGLNLPKAEYSQLMGAYLDHTFYERLKRPPTPDEEEPSKK
jgi:hypothetical protein